MEQRKNSEPDLKRREQTKDDLKSSNKISLMKASSNISLEVINKEDIFSKFYFIIYKESHEKYLTEGERIIENLNKIEIDPSNLLSIVLFI